MSLFPAGVRRRRRLMTVREEMQTMAPDRSTAADCPYYFAKGDRGGFAQSVKED